MKLSKIGRKLVKTCALTLPRQISTIFCALILLSQISTFGQTNIAIKEFSSFAWDANPTNEPVSGYNLYITQTNITSAQVTNNFLLSTQIIGINNTNWYKPFNKTITNGVYTAWINAYNTNSTSSFASLTFISTNYNIKMLNLKRGN